MLGKSRFSFTYAKKVIFHCVFFSLLLNIHLDALLPLLFITDITVRFLANHISASLCYQVLRNPPVCCTVKGPQLVAIANQISSL